MTKPTTFSMADWQAERHRIEQVTLPANMGAFVDEVAERFADDRAWYFFERGEDLTYREMRKYVDRTANALRGLGVRKGSHVAVMSPNCAAFLGSWLALAKLGGVIVPVNTRYTPRELEYVLVDSEAELLLIHDELLAVFEGIGEKPARLTPERVIIIDGSHHDYPYAWDELLAGADGDFVAAEAVGLDDMVNIQYTSGTTGLPKGCMLTHRYWLQGAVATREIVDFPLKSALFNQNFFYMDGPFIALLCFYKGAAFHLCSKPSAARFVEWLRKYAIEYCFYFDPLYKVPETPHDADNQLKLMHIFGFNRAKHADLERRYGCIVREAYGLTECIPALYMPLAATHMVGSGSCGLVAPFREAMIAADDGQPVARGEIGELWLRGPGKMLGYYEKPEATAEVLVDGWFRTGDLFRQDEEGFFYIVGRTKDMVRRNAENIAAREVEEVLRGMPEIKEAAIVPVPDEVTGEEVKAYIQLQINLSKEDVPPEAVLAFCNGRLAPFKIPRYFEYRAGFPMTDSARVEKKKIIAETPDLRLNSYDRVDGVWR